MHLIDVIEQSLLSTSRHSTILFSLIMGMHVHVLYSQFLIDVNYFTIINLPNSLLLEIYLQKKMVKKLIKNYNSI